MKNKISSYIVDSFTNKPFKGNPAAVCLLKTKLKDEQMLLIAKEFGLSETAFVQKLDVNHKYSIRFFSPKMEIPLCGHATLAASKVIFEENSNQSKIHFISVQNLNLIIKRDEDWIEMEFPVYKTVPQRANKELLDALGINEIVNCEYNEETKMLLLEVDDCNLLQKMTPDFEKLIDSHHSINGVLVTARSNNKNYDFESRYFWPWSGTNEDPVTGATHTFLGKYWGERLRKTSMNSFQCSERTGFMKVNLIDDNKILIKSKAQIVLKGNLIID